MRWQTITKFAHNLVYIGLFKKAIIYLIAFFYNFMS